MLKTAYKQFMTQEDSAVLGASEKQRYNKNFKQELNFVINRNGKNLVDMLTFKFHILFRMTTMQSG